MDDAFIMYHAFSDLVSGLFNIPRGETRKLAAPPANCSACGQPLIEIEFRKGFELVCDNYRCYMFRQPQGCRPKGSPECKTGETKLSAT